MIIDRKTTIRVHGQRRSTVRTYSAGCLGLVLLLALVAPTTSATADDGSDHRDLEKRVASDFFVTGFDGATLVATLTGLFPACGSVTTVKTDKYPATPYRTCAGEVKSWDGLELDTRVSFPCNPAPLLPEGTPPPDPCAGVGSTPLPLVVLMHPWGSNRNGMQGTHAQPGHPGNDPNTVLSPARFVAKGYATLVYTARGFQASCGAVDPAADVIGAGGTDVPYPEGCHPKGHTHIAERGFEVADTQHLLGKLVDAGVADPGRLAAAGDSYGGGQSWLLATAMPWDTPADGTRLIQLAAAAPFHGWTDLYGSLVPNGRATDAVDQSRSHEEPFGVVKQGWVNSTYRTGREAAPPLGGGRYNTTDPSELHSFFDGWMAVFSAGEPHASQQARDLPRALRGKSAYYPVADPKNDYLTQLAARRVRPVPIFAVQGWTDFAFPAVEALQMYRKLKAAHPGYPISMLLGDVGHGAQAPDKQKAYSWDQAGNFIDTHLGVAGEGVPQAASFPTLCPSTGRHDPVIGDNWDALVKPSPRTFSSPAFQQTDSSPSNVEEEMASDPQSNSGRCIERPADKSASGASWSWPVEGEFTMLGLPSVTLPYTMTGEDATVVVKLWDIDERTGNKRLVTRGVYRISTPLALGQTESSGSLNFKLFGNHWRFESGHRIELEVGQSDFPFLRPDNLPSRITYARGVEQLSVPQAKTP